MTCPGEDDVDSCATHCNHDPSLTCMCTYSYKYQYKSWTLWWYTSYTNCEYSSMSSDECNEWLPSPPPPNSSPSPPTLPPSPPACPTQTGSCQVADCCQEHSAGDVFCPPHADPGCEVDTDFSSHGSHSAAYSCGRTNNGHGIIHESACVCTCNYKDAPNPMPPPPPRIKGLQACRCS